MNPPRVLLLGIGNLLWADEGFGVRVVETLHSRYQFPDTVQIIDGGTQGLNLLDRVRTADVLIVFDAIDYGLPPGSLLQIEGTAVPKFLGVQKMSLHQTGFQEVLALAEWLGELPSQLLLIGVQPLELHDYGGSLRPVVRAQIDPAIDLALAYLQRFGLYAEPVAEYAAPLAHPALALADYEAHRPSSASACRVGDGRWLSQLNSAIDPSGN